MRNAIDVRRIYASRNGMAFRAEAAPALPPLLDALDAGADKLPDPAALTEAAQALDAWAKSSQDPAASFVGSLAALASCVPDLPPDALGGIADPIKGITKALRSIPQPPAP